MRLRDLVAALALAGLVSAAFADALDDQAASAFARQDWTTAAKLYGDISKRQPTTPNLWRLGRAYMGMDRYEDAKDVLLEAIAATPSDPQTAFSLAITLDHLGDADGAFKYLAVAAGKGLMPQMLETHPALEHLRKDTRFAAVVRQADRAIHVCKYDERYRALDFWRGDWDGYMGAQKILSEKVSVEVDGCMLREEWEGADGGHGRSENFYNPKTREWEQVWVDAGGNVVKLSGHPTQPGVIQMVGDNIDPSGEIHRMRQTWSRAADGKLRRSFEQSDDQGKTWTMVMDLELRPASATASG